jgi:hypothetical protein
MDDLETLREARAKLLSLSPKLLRGHERSLLKALQTILIKQSL